MKKGLGLLLLLFGLLVTFNNAWAQGPGPAPCGDADDPNYNPNMCPIDSWVVIMVVVALFFGGYYLKNKKAYGMPINSQ